MQTYVISYDMAGEGDYDVLYDAIESYEYCACVTESTWVVLTRHRAQTIRDNLRQHLSPGSRLFVAKVYDDVAGQNLNLDPFYEEWLEALLSKNVARLNRLYPTLQLISQASHH